MIRPVLFQPAALMCLVCFSCELLAQGVAINGSGTQPHPSAVLDLSSGSQGLLPPRMSQSQRDDISAPATGLVVFNTDTGCLNVFDGAAWQPVCGGGAASGMSFTLQTDQPAVTVGINDTSSEDPVTVLVNRVSGAPTPVTMLITGLPAGVTYTLTPGGGYPDLASELIFHTTPAAVAGVYPLTITATGGLANQTASLTLEVVGNKRVFLSDSFGPNGNLGGLAGADAICQSQANANSLGGSWVAWLSTSTVHAKDRIGNGIFKRLDGVVIAYSKTDLLDGALQAAPRLTASGEYTGAWAFTGTLSDGTWSGGSSCGNWTSSAGTTQVGDPDSWSSGGWWTQRDLGPCNTGYRIYCFEQ